MVRWIKVSTGSAVTVELETDFWTALDEIAAREGVALGDIVACVDRYRPKGRSRAALLRLLVTHYYRSAATEHGHAAAGHVAHHLGGAR